MIKIVLFIIFFIGKVAKSALMDNFTVSPKQFSHYKISSKKSQAVKIFENLSFISNNEEEKKRDSNLNVNF